MTRYVYGNPFMPRSLEADYVSEGQRPAHQELMELIDLADPAFAAVTTVLREMRDAGVELDSTTVQVAVKLGRQRFDWNKNTPLAADAEMPSALTLASAADSIVYYIRRGPLIKIGTTVDPVQRFRDLLPDEICATEPGARREEQFRHRQFRHLRCLGEHFQPAPELMAHIAEVRGMYGDPDPSWTTSATAATAGMARMLSPGSMEVMTVKEAHDVLGIGNSTIRNWVRRGRLNRAGKEGRNHLYYADDLRALLPRCHRKAA